jgi:hypothetical protein
MVSLAKLLRITQGIGKKYKNIGLEKFQSLNKRNFGTDNSNLMMFLRFNLGRLKCYAKSSSRPKNFLNIMVACIYVGNYS